MVRFHDESLAEYERSGLSQAAFARRAGVRHPTLAHWVQERRRASGAAACAATASPTPRFVELRLASAQAAPPALGVAPAPELSVTLPDGVVVRGAEPSAMAALVRAPREA